MSRRVACWLFSTLVLLVMETGMAQSNRWPQLPTEGFVQGRAAVNKDTADGNAAFVLADGDVPIGQALPIEIPQYAIFNSDGNRIAVIIIQAEEARGQKIAGAVLQDGTNAVGLLSDFELLGVNVPETYP